MSEHTHANTPVPSPAPAQSSLQPRPFDAVTEQPRPAGALAVPRDVAARPGHSFGAVGVGRDTSLVVQPRLRLGPVGDRYEQEAERVAARVAGGLHGGTQAALSAPRIQRLGLGAPSGAAQVPPGVEAGIAAARGGGRPLPAGLRASMEGALGADFGEVRVHNDGRADALNQAIQARAFTTGRDIFVRPGDYSPGSQAGRQLLAHELAHVVQQSAGQRGSSSAGVKSVVQTKLNVAGDDISPVYFNKNRNAIRKVVQKYSRSWLLMMKYILRYIKSNNQYTFENWKAFVTQVRKWRKAKRPRPTYVPPSPMRGLRASQEKEVNFLNDEGRENERVKEGREYTEKKLQGQMGEHAFISIGKEGDAIDVNRILGYNTAGLDAIANRTKPFIQSKLHLAYLEPVKGVELYMNHYNRRAEYAGKFVEKLFKDNLTGKEARDKLVKLSKKWKKAIPLAELVKSFAEEGNIGSGKEELYSDRGDRGPVNIVADNMVFPVPSDIYNALPKKTKPHFISLKHETSWYREVKESMEYELSKSEKTEEEKDPDF